MNKNDVVAYLLVLNDKETIDKIPSSYVKPTMSMVPMLGCLYRVEEQLDELQDIATLVKLKNRERFNGMTASITGPVTTCNSSTCIRCTHQRII